MSRMVREDKLDEEGSCAVSGMESQRMIRDDDEPDDEIAAQTFDDTATEPAVSCDELSEPFDEGSSVKVDVPE